MDRKAFEERVAAQPFAPLWSVLYQCLTDEIVAMRLPPGSKLKEGQTAEELSVSRSPVRMAIARLLEDGLLERVGKQYRVSPVDQLDCMSLCEARIAVESQAAFLAAKRITPRQLAQMAEHVKAFERLEDEAESADLLEYARHDDQFHQIIIDAAGNPYISEMYRSIRSRLLRYRYYLFMQRRGWVLQEFTTVHHKAIYNALRSYSSSAASIEVQEDARRMLTVIGKIGAK